MPTLDMSLRCRPPFWQLRDYPLSRHMVGFDLLGFVLFHLRQLICQIASAQNNNKQTNNKTGPGRFSPVFGTRPCVLSYPLFIWLSPSGFSSRFSALQKQPTPAIRGDDPASGCPAPELLVHRASLKPG